MFTKSAYRNKVLRRLTAPQDDGLLRKGIEKIPHPQPLQENIPLPQPLQENIPLPQPLPSRGGEEYFYFSSASPRLRGLFLASVSILLLLIYPQISQSQTADDILSKFFAVQQGDEIFLRWTIREGNTCEDTYVEHSLDGIYFERIGLISGVCGSPDKPVTYDFYDTMPAPNRLNYYRLELGLYGYSSPQSAEYIVLNDQDYSLQPNPMSDKTTIIFENPTDEEYRFILNDMNGRMVMDFTTSGNRITLYRQELGSGVYVFTLEGNGKVMRGKIAVK